MNDSHQILVFFHDVNLIGTDILAIERNANVLLNAYRDIVLVTIRKTK